MAMLTRPPRYARRPRGSSRRCTGSLAGRSRNRLVGARHPSDPRTDRLIRADVAAQRTYDELRIGDHRQRSAAPDEPGRGSTLRAHAAGWELSLVQILLCLVDSDVGQRPLGRLAFFFNDAAAT